MTAGTAKTDGTPRPSEAIEQLTNGSKYIVYEVLENVEIKTDDEGGTREAALVLIKVADVKAHGKEDACWRVAEGALADRATSPDPPVLTAAADGTRSGMSDPVAYALQATYKRQRA